MRVAVWGLGYVGSVMAGCLADAGIDVVGVDVQPQRVAQVRAGGCPVIEPGVPEAIRRGVAQGRIVATCEPAEAVRGTDLSFVCVGTPPAPDGSLDMGRVDAVCRAIGQELRTAFPTAPHPVVLRSTVMPGTWSRCQALLAEASGGAPGERFTVLLNPEFLREGTGVADFLSPPFTLAGAAHPEDAEPLRRLYSFLAAPFVVTAPGTAELLKTVCNAWHATKVGFANEVGRLAGALDVDPHDLMDLFVRDERLNLSSAYLRPGFAYGGSCLPKDMGALGHLARHHHVELPVIEAVPRSNRLHVKRAIAAIERSGCERIGFLGLSFKPGTDDLRNSPLLDLVQACLGKGLAVRVHDPDVREGWLVGSNRDYALSRVRSLGELLADDAEEMAAGSDLVVVGHKTEEFARVCAALRPDQQVLDLVRAIPPGRTRAKWTGLFG